MSLSISSWLRLLKLALALVVMPIAAMHATTPVASVVPLDERPIIEWSTLSFDELQEWFSDKPQNTVLSFPEGSTISVKIELDNEFFEITSTDLSEPPVLRLRIKKDFLIAKRGSRYWIKDSNCYSWTNLEKILKRTECNIEIEDFHDEYGPIMHLRLSVYDPAVSTSSNQTSS